MTAETRSVVREQTWDLLQRALDSIDYRREPPPSGRRFALVRDDDSNYAVLYVFTYNPNTYRPEEMRHTRHEFVVPVATYHQRQWVRWVFDRIVSIEMHETTEHFFVKTGEYPDDDKCADCQHEARHHDGRASSCVECDGPSNQYRHRFVPSDPTYERLYSPYHGNGWDPYSLWPEGDPIERAKAPGED